MKPFQVSIVTPEKKVWEGQAHSLIAPGLDGYLGVLANHAPLLGALGDGELTLKIENESDLKINLKGGFLEVLHNHVTLLADQAEILAPVQSG